MVVIVGPQSTIIELGVELWNGGRESPLKWSHHSLACWMCACHPHGCLATLSHARSLFLPVPPGCSWNPPQPSTLTCSRRANPNTPLDCWQAVAAFKAEVNKLETAFVKSLQ